MKMPLATRARALKLGASFIEQDLDELRAAIRAREEIANDERGWSAPVTTSHEADAMKAAEWASAAMWLRSMAEQEVQS